MARRKAEAKNNVAADNPASTGTATETVADAALSVVMEVLPENLIINPDIQALRDWNGESRQEMSIPELAASISEEGQIQPGLGWETDDGIMLIAGQRRLEAVRLLRSQGHDRLFKVVVDPSITNHAQAMRKALHENEKRADFTDLERARHIPVIRKAIDAEGAGGTAEVAAFLGCDPATVTQLERLLGLPESIQQAVHTGVMTTSAALEHTTTPVEKIAEVQSKAEELAAKRAAAKARKDEEQEAAQRAKADKAPKKKLVSVPPTEAQKVTAAARKREKETAAKKAAVVTTKDVRQAQKAVEGGTTKLKAPKMSEATDIFEKWNTNDYPPVMALFAGAFVEWSHGKLSDPKLKDAWEDVADEIHAAAKKNGGHRSPVAKVTKAAAKKVVRKIAKPVAKKSVTKSKAKPKTKAKKK